MAQDGTTPRNGLSSIDLMMLGFGNIIGAGLFVASGVAIRQAGPAVLILFLIGALAFYGVLGSIAEMATAIPLPGGLRTFAREALGPWMGFTVGWMFWTSGVFTMSGEVTAAALLTHLWLPNVPVWALSLAFSLLITGINFMDVRGFGKIEGALAVVKVVALIAFVAIGGYFLVFRGAGAGYQTLIHGGPRLGGLFPVGLRGFAASFLMVMITYAGVQVVGMATPETRDPVRSVPRAIRGLTASVVLIYLGAFSVLILLLPWNQVQTDSSPFVQALWRLGLPGVQAVLNLVVLTAALSSMNGVLFGVSRMLQTLARDGEAPRIFLGTTRHGEPGWALAGSSLMLTIAVGLSYWLPSQAYLMITSTSGFIAMFNWSVIALSHLRYRRRLERERPEGLVYRAWGYPYLPILTIAICAAAALTSPLNPGQKLGIQVGIVQFSLISSIYLLVIRPRALRRRPVSEERRAIQFVPVETPDPDDRLRT